MPNYYIFKVHIIGIQTIDPFLELACSPHLQRTWKAYKIDALLNKLCILSYVIKQLHLMLTHERTRKKIRKYKCFKKINTFHQTPPLTNWITLLSCQTFPKFDPKNDTWRDYPSERTGAIHKLWIIWSIHHKL